MAIDRKYGRVTTEKGNIGGDEPVVILRAQDALLVPLLRYYHALCDIAESPQEHLDGIEATIAQVKQWQEHFDNFTQVPQSKESEFSG